MNIFNIEEFECKECGVIISLKGKSSIKVNHHLAKEHHLTKEQYVIKHYYNGVRPTCKCGCGQPVKFVPKAKSNRICFLDYYSCTHVKPSEESIKKIKEKAFIRNHNFSLDDKLNSLHIIKDDLIKSYYDYISFKTNMIEIEKFLNHDNRTIIKLWIYMGLIKNKNDFNEIRRRHQSYWMHIKNEPTYDNYLILKNNIDDIENYLEKLNKKISLIELKNYFNVSASNNYLYDYLLNNLKKSALIKKIKSGSISYLERDFLNILKFYFPNTKIEIQYEIENKVFDFKLGKRILIEIDGAYFHNNKLAIENDKFKNKLAEENKFILIRISEKEIHKIEILQNIKNIYEKYKI